MMLKLLAAALVLGVANAVGGFCIFNCPPANRHSIEFHKATFTNDDEKFNYLEIWEKTWVGERVRLFSNGFRVDATFNYTALAAAATTAGFSFPSGCADNGFKYHIHTLWDYNDGTTYAFGPTACGSAKTSGHYNPVNHAQDEDYGWFNYTIDYNAGDVCDNGNWTTCEQGDFSGKYGNLFPNGPTDANFVVNETDSLVRYSAAFGQDSNGAWPTGQPAGYGAKSIVGHCSSDGSRAFCAKLEGPTDAYFYLSPAFGFSVFHLFGFVSLVVLSI